MEAHSPRHSTTLPRPSHHIDLLLLAMHTSASKTFPTLASTNILIPPPCTYVLFVRGMGYIMKVVCIFIIIYRTFVLKRGAVGSSGTASTGGHDLPLLPLWGQICCRLIAEPDCATAQRISGFINLQRMVSGLPDWIRMWCVVRQNRLRCWKNPEDVGRRMPEQVIELTPVILSSFTSCPEPLYSVSLSSTFSLSSSCHSGHCCRESTTSPKTTSICHLPQRCRQPGALHSI